jgi:hypothetical protein
MVTTILGALAAWGLLAAFWDASFVFSRFHVAAAAPGLLRGLLLPLWFYLKSGVLMLSLFLLAVGCLHLCIGRAHKTEFPCSSLAWVMILAVPGELFLISLPNRFLGHYFLTLLPLAAIGLGLWCQFFLALRAGKTWTGGSVPATWLFRVSTVALALTLIWPFGAVGLGSQARTVAAALHPAPRSQINADVLDYLAGLPAAAPLFIWGAETRLNFLSERAAPTRYNYAYPLLHRRYRQAERFDELLHDLASHPHTVIIDAWASRPQSLGETTQSPSIAPESLEDLRALVAAGYRVDRVFGNGWVVYLPRSWTSVLSR